MSQFKTYSIGVVGENKPIGDKRVNVSPIEKLPAMDGELNFNPQNKTVEGVDSNGQRYESKVIEDVTITATWLPYSSNRVTPPDLRRGELVEILRLGDTDQFYWCDLGLRTNLRRLETVIYAFNGSPNIQDGNDIKVENCYYFEVSTHQKTVTFATSMVNGELCTYTLQFNPGTGQVILEDSIGNSIFLDSIEHLIELQNASDTRLALDKKTLVGYAADKITLTAGSSMVLDAGSTLNFKAPQTTLDADLTTINSQLVINGNTSLNGSFYCDGTASGASSSMTIQGDLDFRGDMVISGSITAARVIGTQEILAPNLRYR